MVLLCLPAWSSRFGVEAVALVTVLFMWSAVGVVRPSGAVLVKEKVEIEGKQIPFTRVPAHEV